MLEYTQGFVVLCSWMWWYIKYLPSSEKLSDCDFNELQKMFLQSWIQFFLERSFCYKKLQVVVVN